MYVLILVRRFLKKCGKKAKADTEEETLAETTSRGLDRAIERWLFLVFALLLCGCGYHTLVPLEPKDPIFRMNNSKKNGVAAMCCFDGPEWMQRRYTAVIANTRQIIPKHWLIQIFHKNDTSYHRGLRVNPGLARNLNNSTNIIFTPLELKRKKRADLILSIELWTKLVADTVLFFSSGGAFCSNGPPLTNYFQYRYLSASNGGLLFVARKSDILNIIHAERNPQQLFLQDKHNPLAYLDHQCRKYIGGITQQNNEQQDETRRNVLRFAAADEYNQTELGIPFAITSTLPKLKNDDRTTLLELCPEAKLIFPALHHPACFGAPSSLDKERCFASLCVSNPRKSGC